MTVLPMAVVLAILSILTKNKRSDVFGLLSLICCLTPPIASIYDINQRMNVHDVAGIMDLYPTMAAAFTFVSILVVMINVVRIIKKR